MKNERPAIDLLEESVNLLRASPQGLLIYLAGAIPFAVALLMFLNDMMLSPFAFDHLIAASLGLAALYIYKNTMQAVFAARLYQTLSPNQTRPLHLARAFVIQCAMQPIGLAIPLPLPWVNAYFRNIALFAALGDSAAARTARRQAKLWTRQTWAVFSITTLAFLALFVNFLAMIVLLPQLVKSFLGVEGEFTRLGISILNASTVAVALALAWLIVDPILDAVFVLRCFYGESIATGEDLRAALRKAIAAVLVLAFLLIPAAPAFAQSQTSLNPAELDRSIDKVIHSREFAWRSAHADSGEEPHGIWVDWIRKGQMLIRNFFKGLAKLIEDLFGGKSGSSTEGGDSPATRRVMKLLIGLVAVLIVAAAVFFFLRRRKPVTQAQAVTAAAPAVNLADESLTADQLPEASWLKLAEELLAQGDCRLALRALHLAGLNYLGEHNIVSIRRWKTGLEYAREVQRRTRANPDLGPLFSSNVDIFERGWYGQRPVSRETVESFAAGLNQMRTHARQ